MKQFVVAVLLLVMVGCSDNSNQQLEIKFSKCIDGDTARFIINGKEEKVRFLGIDTPESTNIQEEYGEEASNYTCEVLKKANNIYIEYDINSNKRDKYDRVLGWIFVDNNNLSELLLSRGYAEVNYIYGDYKYIDELCVAQKNAYKDNLGIWGTNTSKYKNNYCTKNGY
ncbi:MAG: thermonuclease family protein [Bacilli bacterium]|nr:thermonuclease family protein [Bacilli bacterium]